MNEQATPAEGDDHEDRMWSAIEAFEQILEAMPEDRAALETLTEAYESIGDRARAIDYLLRLARVVIEEEDRSEAPAVLDRFERIADESPQVLEMKSRLQALREEGSEDAPEPEAAGGGKSSFDVTEEVALAWRLLQADQISRDQYTQIVQDLSDSRSRQMETPVSVLHALEDRQFKNAVKILCYMAQNSSTAVIALSQFEINADDFKRLPLEWSTRRGAMPFGHIVDEPMVAILNPFDDDLRTAVQRVLGCRAHFFLVPAAEYDQALASMRRLLKTQAEGPGDQTD